MRPLQALSVVLAIVSLAGLVWWVAHSGVVGPRVAGPARYEDVERAEARRRASNSPPSEVLAAAPAPSTPTLGDEAEPARAANVVQGPAATADPNVPLHARAPTRAPRVDTRPRAVLIGRVIDAATSAPIEGFRLEAATPPPRALVLPAVQLDGRFRVELDLDGHGDAPFALRVTSPEHAPLVLRDLALAPGGEHDLGELRLVPAPSFDVRVLDAFDESPLAGVDVRVQAIDPTADEPLGWIAAYEDEQRALSDAQGRAHFRSRPGRRARIHASHPAYALHSSAAIELPASEPGEHVLRLSRGGAVAVLALDAHGLPAANLRVLRRSIGVELGADDLGALPEGATTDAQGRARFERLAPGWHAFHAPGASAADASSASPGSPTVLPPGWIALQILESAEQSLELRLTAFASLAGSVSAGGVPLANARLALRAAGSGDASLAPSAETDALGRFRFEAVVAGAYELDVDHAARAMTWQLALELVEGANERVLELPVASVEGRVTGAAGRALEGAWVGAERDGSEPSVAGRAQAFDGARAPDDAPARGWVRSGVGGRYRLDGLLPNVPIRIEARETDHRAARSTPLELEQGEQRAGVDLALEPGGRVDVRVIGGDGELAAGVVVFAYYEGEAGDVEPRRALSSADGTQGFRGLAPGPWRITLAAAPDVDESGDDARSAPETARVEVVAGELRTVELRQP